VESVIFPKVYERHTEGIAEGKAVVVKGRAQVKEEQNAVVICNELSFVEPAAPGRTPQNEKLWLKLLKDADIKYDKIMGILRRYPGETPVVLYDERTQKRTVLNREFWARTDDALIRELKGLLGDGCVAVK
jgi:DNA polymerase-3 subunit alpha